MGTFLARRGLHHDCELVDAPLLVVGYGELEPQLEGRQLVSQNLHDFVWVVGELVLWQLEDLVLGPVDGDGENRGTHGGGGLDTLRQRALADSPTHRGTGGESP